MKFFSTKTVVLLLLAAFTCSATEFCVKPGDGSFDKAAKNWKKGDSIILAPGTYYNRFAAGNKIHAPCGLTIKAEIPGTALFRGDRPAPKFQKHAKNIWKAHWDTMPETVFERDTLTHYDFYATLTGVQQNSKSWTYDAKTKMLYIRTTDSGDPARHYLSIGVTPWCGINFYCTPQSSGVQDILLDGFITTGFYSRLRYPDQRIASSQHKVAWGIVISHPTKNVKVNNVTAVLNAYGIGFCGNSVNSSIENCRAFGNRNPFNVSGGGIGIHGGADKCIIRHNIGGDNAHDVWLYGGLSKASTVFEENKGYDMIRIKIGKEKDFAIRNCVANRFSHVGHPRHMYNCAAFEYVQDASRMRSNNLLMRYESQLNADEIFADPANLDCRAQGGIDPAIAKHGLTLSSEKIFYWKQNGKDTANGHSVKNAFGSAERVLKELAKPGTEIYVAGAVKGDLKLKGLKDVAIRGRGKFPVAVQGRIILENCSNIKLERLAPAEFIVQGGSNILITQSAGKISANKVNGLNIKHNYIPVFMLKDCTKCFITANVFEKALVADLNGWIDYNAYAGKVPASEKNSFTAKAQLGKNFTFQNAWQFDGCAIDAMPVGPYRRQYRNAELILNKPEVQLFAPDMVMVKLSANLPFNGTLRWGDPTEDCVHDIKLDTNSNTYAIPLTGLKPGKKYYVKLIGNTSLPECFSNAELKKRDGLRKAETEDVEFTTPLKYATAKNCFVAKNGSDLNDGSKEKPFRTIGHAINQLRPGDTLTICGGIYEENFSVQVSGTKEKPIVIQGMRGERVILRGGYGSPLAGGILVMNQNFIHFKDFVIHGSSIDEGFSDYAFRTVNCKGLLFKRLLICGATHKIHAINCEDIFVEDCGFNGGHEGVMFIDCKNQVFSHCTFATAGVMHLMVHNQTHGAVLLENCIFVDALNMKGSNPLILISDIEQLTERNNCYWTRLPFDQKPMISWNMEGKKKAEKRIKDGDMRESPYCGRRQLTYAEYQKERKNLKSGSFNANPGIAVFPTFAVTYKSMAEWQKNWRKNQKKSYEEGWRLSRKPELLRDLKYFLPTNPEVIKRDCGPRLK